MDLYQLDCFRTVARMQHISNAAAVLHITQSALSKIIVRVEEYVGTPLFDRVKGKIYLNKSGEIFLRHLDNMFTDLNTGLDEVRSISNNLLGQVCVASCVDNIIFRVTEQFFSEQPDIKIKFSVMSPDQISGGFLHGNLDFALTTYPVTEPGVEWEQVAEEEIVMIVGESSPFYGRREIQFAELRDVEMMCENLGGDLRTLVDRCCERAGFKANVVLESSAGAAMGFTSGMVRAVSFMPIHRFMQISRTKARPGRSISAVRLKNPPCARVTGIARRTGPGFSEQAQKLLDYVHSYFKDLDVESRAFAEDYFSGSDGRYG